MNLHIKLYSPEKMPAPHGYSQLAEITGSGRMIYLSGQVAEDLNGNVVGRDDISAQTHQVFSNIGAAMEAAGGSLDNLVKLTVYLKDISQIRKFREIRDRYVNTDNPPVSTTVQVVLDAPEWLIEVEAMAIIPNDNQ